jgi:CBS domain-containing protein
MQPTVRDVMTCDLVTIPPEATVRQLERLFVCRSVDEVFVVDGEGCLLGSIPDYTILQRRLTSLSASAEGIGPLVSRRIRVIGPDSTVNVAARYLREHVHRRLAVVDGHRLIGQVTRRDVLVALVAADEPGELMSSARPEQTDDRAPSHRPSATSPSLSASLVELEPRRLDRKHGGHSLDHVADAARSSRGA